MKLLPPSRASGLTRASAFADASAVSPAAAPGPRCRAQVGKQICWNL